ncbi:Serine/threonine-protein kinase CTR1, partial [Tetrabaena socialis]
FMGYTLTPEPSIVTEFCARGSLFHILRQGGDRPPDARLQRAVAVAVARGMAYLHSRQPPILHLDLKSPNVLIDDRNRVKIADFGLSRMRQRTYVSSGAASGSPEWMAPEVLRCERYAEAADVYSFGVVLWELLTGQAPWADLNAMQVVGAVGFARRSLPDPTEGEPLLLRLCQACRALDPTHRPDFKQILAAMDKEYAPLTWGGNAAAAAGDAGDAAAAATGAEAGGSGAPAAAPTADARAAPAGAAAGESTPAGASRRPEGQNGPPAAAATLTPAASTRMTRRHSLATSPDPSDLLGAAAATTAGGGGGSASSGGAGMGGTPARLDARFASTQESPRSRRRYRSPRGEDTDGRKTPSPRTASAQLWRLAADDEDGGGGFVRQEGNAAAAKANDAAAAAGSGRAAVGASSMRAPPMHGGSPFADYAAASFPAGLGGSVQDVRVLVPPAEAIVVGRGADDEGGPTDMEVGSPRAQDAPAQPPAQQQQQQQRAHDQQQSQPAPYGQPQHGAAAVIITDLPKQGELAPIMPRDASGEPLQSTAGPSGLAQGGQHAEQYQPSQQQSTVPQLTAASSPTNVPRAAPAPAADNTGAAPHLHPFGSGSPGASAAARNQLLGRLAGRPGHRRVASAEAHLVQQQRLSAVLALAASGGGGGTADGGGGSSGGARAASGAAALAMAQQQRLLAAAAAAAGGAAAAGLPPGGMPPPGPRRSRGLARNSAPMRYTYGGAGAGTVSGGPQQHPLGPPPQLAAAEHHLRMAAGGSSAAPSTPGGSAGGGGGGGGGATPGSAAALGAPVSLSPLPDAEWAPPRGLAGGGGLGFEGGSAELPGGGGGSYDPYGGSGAYDPWPDTTSELSFAFILGESGSLVSDADLASASLDRLPLLEEDEALYVMSDPDEGQEEPGAADSSDAEQEAAAAAEAAFELRPFALSPARSPPTSPSAATAAALPTSPFAAAASGQPPWGSAAAGSAAAPVPEADLWAALQNCGSGLRGGGQSHGLDPAVQPTPQHPHHHDSRPQQPPGPQPVPAAHEHVALQQQQALARTASGGGALSYRSGRFKVTLEPAGSAPPSDGGAPPPPPPPPPQPSDHGPMPQPPSPAGGAPHGGAASPGPSPATRAGSASAGAPGLVAPALSLAAAEPHHHSGVLNAAGPPPVALNSCTMYRKGRFFISSHSAGAHCATTTMHPSLGSGSGGSGSGESGGHPAESEEGGQEGGSGPASPRGAAAAAAAAAHGSGGSSPRVSSGGAGPMSPPGLGAAAPEPARPPLQQLMRQYSSGRFRVAESLVAPPPPGLRRPSSVNCMGAGLAAALPCCPPTLLQAVVAHVAPHVGWAADAPVSQPGLPPAADVRLQPAVMPPPPPPPASAFAPAFAAAGWADAAAEGGEGAAPAQAPASPRGVDPQVSVRRVGRFTVRELDREAQAGGMDASSRGPSGSGTPTQVPAAMGNGDDKPRKVDGGCWETEAARVQQQQLQHASSSGSYAFPFKSRALLLPGGGSSGLLCSPPDDPMLLSSRHSSCSVASGSGCSRSSSASGLELDTQQQQQQQQRQPRGRKELTWRLPEPEQQQQPQQQQPQQQEQQQQQQQQEQTGRGGGVAPAPGAQHGLGVEAAAAAPPAGRTAATSPMVRVKSKGRFTVIEHEEGALEGGQGAQGQAAMLRPAVAVAQPRQVDEGGGGGGAAAAAAAEWPWIATSAAADHAPEQRRSGPATAHGLYADPIAAVPEPHFGGILHPAAPLAPPRPRSQPPAAPLGGAAGLQSAAGGQGAEGLPQAAPAQGGTEAAAAPWGQSGPQGPIQQAQLREEVARMVRERMARNNGGPGGQQQQQQQQQEEGGFGLPAGAAEAGSGAGGARARCTYEVTFGAGLRIHISHQLQGGGGGAGAGGGMDAVMMDMDVDVGIGDGSSSEGEGEAGAGGGAGAQGAGGDEPDLQPPDTPAYERPASPDLPEPGQSRRRAGHSRGGDDGSNGAGASGSEGLD